MLAAAQLRTIHQSFFSSFFFLASASATSSASMIASARFRRMASPLRWLVFVPIARLQILHLDQTKEFRQLFRSEN
jgi:hypothetical protein